jgi:molecular chaperone DnaK
MDLKTDKLALQRLKEAAEKAKIELVQRADPPRINLPSSPPAWKAAAPPRLTSSNDHPRRSREARRRADRAHQGADAQGARRRGLKASDIDDVVLVGGMTRMPRVREV